MENPQEKPMRKMPGKRVPRMEILAERKMRNHPREARTEQRRRPEQIALLCFFHSFHFATQVTTKTSNSTEQAS